MSLAARLERLEARVVRPVRCLECGGPGGIGVILDGELGECSVCEGPTHLGRAVGLLTETGSVLVTLVRLHSGRSA